MKKIIGIFIGYSLLCISSLSIAQNSCSVSGCSSFYSGSAGCNVCEKCEDKSGFKASLEVTDEGNYRVNCDYEIRVNSWGDEDYGAYGADESGSAVIPN